MDIEVSAKEKGILISILSRVDAFNFEQATQEIYSAIPSQKKVAAIDLSHTKFLSFKSIQFLHRLATELKNEGGFLALVGPSEKLKRQIDIYASLEPFYVFRSVSDWETSFSCTMD